MTSYESILNKKSWFEKTGLNDDVIISSRVRISRNISDFSFPDRLKPEDEKTVTDRIVSVLTDLPGGRNFTILYSDGLSGDEKRLVFERNMLGEGASSKRNKTIAVSEDKEIVVFINQDDHLKLSSIKSGLALKEAWDQLNELDTLLENRISYSVSDEYGYLTSAIGNIGTAMKASILVHLPGLVMTSLLSEMFKILREKGLSTKPYGAEDEGEDSNIFEIYNYFTIGSSEEEIIQILTELSMSLLSLERKMRGIVYEKKRKRLEDRIFRALGILRYSRSISRKEALKLLSLVRLGISLNIVNEYSMEQVTSLIMSAYMNPQDDSAESKIDSLEDSKPLDYLRAQTIREVLVI